jgi:methionyl-tRNA formyltransferase
MGSPPFAIPSLEQILSSSHKIAGVVTQPDKVTGRGKRILPTAVKKYALHHHLHPILQPVSLKDKNFIDILQTLSADLFVVVAFRILPAEVFKIPQLGTLNLHPSLLPKYRGAAPLNWTIINGERETGITVIKITEKVDAGGILLQEKRKIFPDETVGSLHDRLSKEGASLLLRAIDQIADGNMTLKIQDEIGVTPAPKISPEMCHLNFNQPVDRLKNWIHGLSPQPGGYAFYHGERIKIFKARTVSEKKSGKLPGTILEMHNHRPLVACQPGTIELLQLQREGKKILPAEEFIKGFNLTIGEKFE